MLNKACGALLTRPDRRGVTSFLLVGGCTTVVTGVFRWVWVAAVGLRAAACLGVREQQVVVLWEQ